MSHRQDQPEFRDLLDRLSRGETTVENWQLLMQWRISILPNASEFVECASVFDWRKGEQRQRGCERSEHKRSTEELITKIQRHWQTPIGGRGKRNKTLRKKVAPYGLRMNEKRAADLTLLLIRRSFRKWWIVTWIFSRWVVLSVRLQACAATPYVRLWSTRWTHGCE